MTFLQCKRGIGKSFIIEKVRGNNVQFLTVKKRKTNYRNVNVGALCGHKLSLLEGLFGESYI